MNKKKLTLKNHIKEMKSIAEILIPYTYPQVNFFEEEEVMILKQRTFCVDGYEVLVCFSKSNYEKYFLSSLQIQSVYGSFLPFFLVCKLAKKFLGNKHLAYIEFLRNNNKVYCWTVKSRNGRSLPPDFTTKPGSYEGFQFDVLQSGSVELY